MVAVIGVGNPHRSDDAIGIWIANRLKTRIPDSVVLLTHSGEASTLMDLWKNHDTVVILDALSSGGKAGSLYVHNATVSPLPETFSHTSSHSFGVNEAIELARVLNELPPVIWVIGIEGACFDAGTEFSPALESVLDSLEISISQKVQSLLYEEN